MSMWGRGHHNTFFLASKHSRWIGRNVPGRDTLTTSQRCGGVWGVRGLRGQSQGGVDGGLCRNNAAVALEVRDPPSSAGPV